MKPFIAILPLVALAACVAPEEEPMGGWTRVEGPVAYDDGTLLRGTLTIDAQDNMRMATLSDVERSRSLLFSTERAFQLFTPAMIARTGCQRVAAQQSSGQGEIRLLLYCD
jgi:hypothetical protein